LIIAIDTELKVYWRDLYKTAESGGSGTQQIIKRFFL